MQAMENMWKLSLIFKRCDLSTSREIISIDCNGSIKNLKDKFNNANEININNHNFVHRGHLLRDNEILRNTDVKSGSTIYCFSKLNKEIPSAIPLSLVEVQQLLVSIRASIANPNFRPFIHKLRSNDQINRLVNECLPLKKDPASLANILDPDFIISLQNTESLTKRLEDRPVIGRALQIIMTMFTSETVSPKSSHQVSYSLDALSDEEMETEEPELVRRNSSFQPITPAQLAAALASAAGPSNQIPIPGSTTSAPRSGLTTPFNTPAPPSGGGTSPGGFIGNDIFSQALQNALAASASSNFGSANQTSSNFGLANQTSNVETTNPPTNQRLPSGEAGNMEENLQLMHEMGIQDDVRNLQALNATNGDVQAAIHLIFARMADE